LNSSPFSLKETHLLNRLRSAITIIQQLLVSKQVACPCMSQIKCFSLHKQATGMAAIQVIASRELQCNKLFSSIFTRLVCKTFKTTSACMLPTSHKFYSRSLSPRPILGYKSYPINHDYHFSIFSSAILPPTVEILCSHKYNRSLR